MCMPPNQTTPPQGGHDQYAFIMADQPKQRPSFLPSGNAPKKQRILYGLGLLGVLVVFGIILTLIFTAGGGNSQPLVGLAQSQNEIIRVANLGSREVKGASTLAFAQNTILTLTTDQQATLALIAKSSKAPDAKQLALTQDSATDAKLQQAVQASRFDETFQQTLVQELTDYRNQINDAYKGTNSNSQKTALKQMYDHVTILLKGQAPATN